MELINLLLLGIINCMVIIGFHLAVQFRYKYESTEAGYKGQYVAEPSGIDETTKNIFWWIKYWGDNYLTPFWRKPIYDCPRCMASLHSTYVYFPLIQFTWITFNQSLYIYPVYILFLSGLVEVITRKFEI